MADYNPNTVSAYQQYASSMSAGGGGSNMSGLGSRTSTASMTTAPSGSVDFTTINPSTGKQKKVATIDYGDDDGGPVSPTVIYAAAAEAATQAGSVFTPQGPTANAMNLYSMPNMSEIVSDYVYRADRDDAITSAISGVQAEEQEQINAAISSVNSAITMGKTDAEIAEAFLNDMGGMGSDEPDPLGGYGVPGVTITDVTGTDAGALSNPQPLYDFAEEMANPSITTTELPPMSPEDQASLGAAIRKAAEEGTLSSKLTNLQFVRSDGDRTDPSYWASVLFPDDVNEEGEQIVDVSPAAEAADQQGLMSRPTPVVEDVAEEVDDTTSYSMNNEKMKEEYVLGYLADLEGTQAHSSLEGGADTAAYGVKNSMGLDREDFKTDADFAAAVAFKHYNAAGKNFKETNRNIKVWSELGDKGRYAVTDLHYNVGTIGSTGKKSTPKAALENTLEFIGMTAKDGAKVSLMSLATRRAKNWNKAADSLGLTKIDKVQQIPTKKGTTFKYLDKSGNTIYTVTSGRRAVSLNSDGSYTALTETRQEEL